MPGWLRWENDDLTPGKSKDGGLHANLFDNDGKLKRECQLHSWWGSDSSTTDDPAGAHNKSHEQGSGGSGLLVEVAGEVVAFVADVAMLTARQLAIDAAPHAKRLWEEKGRPALEAKRDEVAQDAKRVWDEKAQPIINRQVARQVDKFAARKVKKAAAEQPIVVEGEVVTSCFPTASSIT